MTTDNKNQRKTTSYRPLAVSPPYATEIGLLNFKKLLDYHRQLPVTAARAIEARLIARAAALQFLLISEGGTTTALPFERLEKLVLDAHAASNGFVRWNGKKQKANAISIGENCAGPRQFLYQSARCHLAAFTRFRLKEMKAAEGRLLFPKLARETIVRAQTELCWLKQVKGNPTWRKVFAAYLQHCLNLLATANIPSEQSVKFDVAEFSELSLSLLYQQEPPFTLEVRRGKSNYASLPDAQFNKFLPLKEKLKKKKSPTFYDSGAEEIEEYYLGDSTDGSESDNRNLAAAAEDAEEKPMTARSLASIEVRRFLDHIVDNDTTYSQALTFAERLVKEDLFNENAAGDVRLLMLWLIDRLRRKKKKGNRVASLYTYSQRLLFLIDEFEGERFADLKLEDIMLFLSQSATTNTAKGYRLVARTFHTFLKNEVGLPVQDINWDSPLLHFSGSYRERGLITESEFKELLNCAASASRLGESQAQMVLLLLRRVGLRCAEVARLTIKNFSLGIEEPRLNVRFSKSDAGKRSLPLDILLDRDELKFVLEFLKPFREKMFADQKWLDRPLIAAADGTAFKPEQIGAETGKIMRVAHLSAHTPHGLRHAFASGLLAAHWLNSNNSQEESVDSSDSAWARTALHKFCRPAVEGRAVTYADDIRRLMGHASLTVTLERYIHLIDLILADAVRLGEKSAPAFFMDVETAASLAGVTVREVRRRFPAELRAKSENKELAKIESARIEQWLISRLPS